MTTDSPGHTTNASDATFVLQPGVLSILIPVYNERAFLRTLVERVIAVSLPGNLRREIIIVDDASTDATDQVILKLTEKYPDTIRAFRQPVNMGKGAAIRRAIDEMSGQYALIQDADLEYDPRDYELLLQPLLEGDADVVYGSRFASRTIRRVFNFHHAVGNRFLTLLSNLTTGLDLTDMETCYKAFRSDLLKTIPLRSNRFGIEPEITAKIAKRGCSVYEVPISYRGRAYSEGKKIGWKDGVNAVTTILKYWIIDDCFNERFCESILKNISSARRFNQWMVSLVSPHLGLNILEVGSGLGNISRYLPKKEKLTLTDTDPRYLDVLRNMFSDNDLVSVRELDLENSTHFDAFNGETFDTVVCLNVLEHIRDDESSLRNMRRLLNPTGSLVLLVPQYESLFGTYDTEVGHHRRYSKKALVRKVRDAGFDVLLLKNFGFLPIFGWWLNARILKHRQMSRWQLKLYDILVPFLRPVERFLPLPGISLICIARPRA